MPDGTAMRVAGLPDVEALTETLTSAFAADPVWGWAFPKPADASGFWRILVEGALRYPWTLMTPGAGAVAVWIPPGGDELTPEAAASVEPMIRTRLAAPDAERVLGVMAGFEAAGRPDEPHYYLSLLGTRLDQRGQGLGMQLLRDCLAEIDALHAPSSLESTNPANLGRYESVGFERTGSFTAGPDGPVITQMWRPAR